MYKIDKLNYNLNDLEKFIDIKTLNLQYQLMTNYLDELNKLLIKNNYDYRYEITDLASHIDIFPIIDRDNILYNLGGYLNHLDYFISISPYNQNIPISKINNAINKKYGSYKNFKNIFINEAMNLVGSGYTYLILDDNYNLNIINLTNEETPYEYKYIPLITLDLWEHAYMNKYGLNKKIYIESFIDNLDFIEINKKYINIIEK